MPGQQFDRAAAGDAAITFFPQLWTEADPWDLETSPLDQERYRLQLGLLADQRYGRVLGTRSVDNGIMSGWLIRSYRALARNVGFVSETSETLLGTKDEVRFEICVDLFEKPAP